MSNHPVPLETWRAAGERFEHRGQRIFFRDSGKAQKPALLLIHGFPTASWDWHGIWPALAERYRLIAPDMLGFGFSDKPRDHVYSIAEQADIHEALCAQLGVAEVDVLAHDYGVSVAQELLVRQQAQSSIELPPPLAGEGGGGGGAAVVPPPSLPPQAGGGGLRLRSIVFLNGGLFPEAHRPRLIQKLLLSPLGPLVSRLMNERSFARSFSAIFGAATQPSADELAAFWQLIAHNGGDRIMHRLIRYILDRRVQRERWLAAMQATTVPLLLINGPDDPVSGAHLVARYRELMPRPRVVSLPGIGHYPQVEAPEAVLAAFFAFHASLAERPG